MRIYLDGDGCPVVALTLRVAADYSVPCTLLCDTSHVFSLPGTEVVVCDRGADSVDLCLANRISPGDLCVTQDFGLAALCLSRGALALRQDGLRYTEDNIGGLLEARAFAAKVRRGGGRLRGPSKRTKAEDADFERALRRLLEEQAC